MWELSRTNLTRIDKHEDIPPLRNVAYNLGFAVWPASQRKPVYVCCKDASALPAFATPKQLQEFTKLISHRQMLSFTHPQSTLESLVLFFCRGRDHMSLFSCGNNSQQKKWHLIVNFAVPLNIFLVPKFHGHIILISWSASVFPLLLEVHSNLEVRGFQSFSLAFKWSVISIRRHPKVNPLHPRLIKVPYRVIQMAPMEFFSKCNYSPCWPEVAMTFIFGNSVLIQDKKKLCGWWGICLMIFKFVIVCGLV